MGISQQGCTLWWCVILECLGCCWRGAALCTGRAQANPSVPGRVHCEVEVETEETTEMIKGLQTSLMQKDLVVSAQETIRRG